MSKQNGFFSIQFIDLFVFCLEISCYEKAFLHLGLDCPEFMPSTNRKLKVAKDDKVVCFTIILITHKALS